MVKKTNSPLAEEVNVTLPELLNNDVILNSQATSESERPRASGHAATTNEILKTSNFNDETSIPVSDVTVSFIDNASTEAATGSVETCQVCNKHVTDDEDGI